MSFLLSLKTTAIALSQVLVFTAVLLLASPSVTQAHVSSVDEEPHQMNGEVLIAKYQDGMNAVTTENSYAGRITITVSGIGQASSTQYSDAFYILTDFSGNPIPPEHPYEWVLWINGRPAKQMITGGNPPAYRGDHTYTFDLNTPGGKLTFGVGDGYTADNTGSYIIRMESTSSQMIPYFSQRNGDWIQHPLRTTPGGCDPSCAYIGTCGCTLTSATMLFAYYGASLNPPQLSDCLDTKACPFDWWKAATCSNGKARYVSKYSFSWERLDQELNQNSRPVILGMHKRTDKEKTHWVLVTSGKGDNPRDYLVHDPWPLNGADTNLAVIVRQDYVFDEIAVYSGSPASFSSATAAGAGAVDLEPLAVQGFRHPQIVSAGSTAAEATAVVSGTVMLYYMNETAAVVTLEASSIAGDVVEMQIWTDSSPSEIWQPFDVFTWVPWAPDDKIYARFRDEMGNVSSTYLDTTDPAGVGSLDLDYLYLPNVVR